MHVAEVKFCKKWDQDLKTYIVYLMLNNPENMKHKNFAIVIQRTSIKMSLLIFSKYNISKSNTICRYLTFYEYSKLTLYV